LRRFDSCFRRLWSDGGGWQYYTKAGAGAIWEAAFKLRTEFGANESRGRFLARWAGYGLFLSHAEAVMVVQNPAGSLRSTTVRMRPVGADPSAQAEPLERLPGKSNYFNGNVPGQWRTGIPNYAKVRYRNVYPGIDLVYYGNQRQLEYDFVVSPGNDPGAILLELQGTEKIQLDGHGNILMQTPKGDLRWHRPIAYQEVNGSRTIIGCAYVRKGAHQLAFRLDDYDRTKTLVIDPVLEYSTYLGGSVSDGGNGIAVDRSGNAYVTGTTISPDFPTEDAFQKRLKGNQNAFVTKIDAADCALVYSTYPGGTGGDSGNGIAVDALGDAYVTGSSDSPDFPITEDAFQKMLKGATNAFVTKLDAAGSALVYSTYLGGSGSDSAAGIAVDAHDSAYVSGNTTSSDFPTSHAFQENLKSSSGNAFVAKFDAAGTALVYSTFLGGSSSDAAAGIAVDARDNAYVTGYTASSDFPTIHAFQAKLKDSAFSAFVTKIDAAGTALVYSTYLGGSVNDFAAGIAVDARDNAYVTGSTASPDFPTMHAFQPKNKESLYFSAFVTKFDAAGTALVYSTYLGGSKHKEFARFGTVGAGIAVDSRGDTLCNRPDRPHRFSSQKRVSADVEWFSSKRLCHQLRPSWRAGLFVVPRWKR
jgi:hypothetical protein